MVSTDFASDPGIIEARDFVITSNAYGRVRVAMPLAPLKDEPTTAFTDLLTPDMTVATGNHAMNLTGSIWNLEAFLNKATVPAIKWDAVTYSTSPPRLCISHGGQTCSRSDPRSCDIPKSFVFWVARLDNRPQSARHRRDSQLRFALRKGHLGFVHLKFIPDWVSIAAVRASRVAPAIAGRWQFRHNSPPVACSRTFIRGRLGVSKFQSSPSSTHDCTIPGHFVPEFI